MTVAGPVEAHPQLAAHYEIAETETQSIAEISRLLTRGTADTLEHLRQIDRLEDKDALRANASFMHDTLAHEGKELRIRIDDELEQLSPTEQQRTRDLLEAIDGGDEERMKALGINVEYAWLSDIVATMIKGKPPVEIETVGPYAAMHLDKDTGQLDVDIAKIPNEEMTGILVASILRKIDPIAHNTRVVSLMDEWTTFGDRQFTKEEQDQYIVAMAEFYGQAGVIKSDDEPGKDFIILRESELAMRVDELEHKLQQSGRGQVVTDEQGDTFFMPDKELVESLALHNKKHKRELANRGILIRRANGRPTCQAMDAAGFLNDVNRELMHVVMLDQQMENQQDKTYALLKALDVVRQERYHNILFDSRTLSPELTSYGIAKLLELHTAKFLKALDQYDEWEKFDPYEYVHRNYGEKVLEEDAQIISVVTQALRELGIEPRSLKKVADVGSGPNLYPSMLMAPYVGDAATIDMIEYSPANRQYMSKVIGGSMTGDDAETWHKFEHLMVQAGGDRYQDCETRAKQAAVVKAGSIFELPKGEYDLVSSYFVAESIVDTKLPFREAIQALANAVKHGGSMIIAHMVGSEGYYAGESTHFPAVNLSIKDLEEAYRDANLDFTIVPVGENATEKAREGYHGMAVVVATPKH